MGDLVCFSWRKARHVPAPPAAGQRRCPGKRVRSAGERPLHPGLCGEDPSFPRPPSHRSYSLLLSLQVLTEREAAVKRGDMFNLGGEITMFRIKPYLLIITSLP